MGSRSKTDHQCHEQRLCLLPYTYDGPRPPKTLIVERVGAARKYRRHRRRHPNRKYPEKS